MPGGGRAALRMPSPAASLAGRGGALASAGTSRVRSELISGEGGPPCRRCAVPGVVRSHLTVGRPILQVRRTVRVHTDRGARFGFPAGSGAAWRHGRPVVPGHVQAVPPPLRPWSRGHGTAWPHRLRRRGPPAAARATADPTAGDGRTGRGPGAPSMGVSLREQGLPAAWEFAARPGAAPPARGPSRRAGARRECRAAPPLAIGPAPAAAPIVRNAAGAAATHARHGNVAAGRAGWRRNPLCRVPNRPASRALPRDRRWRSRCDGAR